MSFSNTTQKALNSSLFSAVYCLLWLSVLSRLVIAAACGVFPFYLSITEALFASSLWDIRSSVRSSSDAGESLDSLHSTSNYATCMAAVAMIPTIISAGIFITSSRTPNTADTNAYAAFAGAIVWGFAIFLVAFIVIPAGILGFYRLTFLYRYLRHFTRFFSQNPQSLPPVTLTKKLCLGLIIGGILHFLTHAAVSIGMIQLDLFSIGNVYLWLCLLPAALTAAAMLVGAVWVRTYFQKAPIDTVPSE